MTKFLLSAHVLVSSETLLRTPLVNRLEEALTPLTQTGRLERISENDAAALMKSPGITALPVNFVAAEMDDETLRPLVRALQIRQVSNSLKHLEALRRIAALESADGSGTDPDARFSLVVEDDAVFGESMQDALFRAASDAPDDADIVFVGLPSTRLPEPGSKRSVFDDPLTLYPNGGVLPACESYLVTPGGARRLAEAFLPLRLGTTGHLTYLFRKKVAKPYLSVPNVFVDGSKIGVTVSTIEANSQLIWNQDYCLATELLRQNAPVEQFEAAWERQPFKNHPDCIVQQADSYAQRGKIEDAKEMYDRALKTYAENNGIINTHTEFMKRYMSMYGRD